MKGDLLLEWLSQTRRHFNGHPELSGEEVAAMAHIKKVFDSWGSRFWITRDPWGWWALSAARHRGQPLALLFKAAEKVIGPEYKVNRESTDD